MFDVQTTSDENLGSSEIFWCGDMVQYRAKVCQYVDHLQRDAASG